MPEDLLDSAAVTNRQAVAEEWQVHLALESRFENIELVQVVLEDSLQRLECDEDTRYWVGIAVREAVANAIKHGNRQDPDKSVEVGLHLEGADVIVVRVVDEGEGFDPADVDDPLEEENLLKPNGRGIFYIRKFMDDIQYNFLPNGGTELTLKKRITPRDSGLDKEEDSE